VSGRTKFHAARLVLWAVQVPVALFTPLKSSIAYLCFLSIAALIESSFTDFDQSRQADKDAS
jgi:hypothetical protein